MSSPVIRIFQKILIRLLVLALLPLVGFFGGRAHAAENLRLDFSHKRAVGPELAYLIDPTSKMDIHDVMAPTGGAYFSPIGGKRGFGYSRSTFWFRFAADNPLKEKVSWYLEYVYPVVDEIDFYIPGPDKMTVYHSGDRRPFDVRPVYFRTSVFPIEQSHGRQTYYIRIKSNGSITIPLVAWTQAAFDKHKYWDIAFYWIYYGILLATVLYNFFIYLSVREISYLYLVVAILGCSIFTMVHSGLAFQYLWPTSLWWANICHAFFGFIGLLGSFLFTRSFLNTRNTSPRFDRILSVMSILGLILVFSPFFLEYLYATQMLAFFGTAGSLIMISGGTVLLLRGSREARFFLLAWSAWAISVMLMFLKSYGFLPSNLLTDSGVQLGTGLLMILFSLGLADKINTIQKERERALEEVRRSERRYRLLAENVKDVIWTIDLPTMRYTYITPSVEGFRGYTCEEAMALNLEQTLTPQSRVFVKEEIKKELEREIQTGAEPSRSRTVELEYRHKDGSTVWAEVTTTFIRDAEDRPIGITGVTRDITDRRKGAQERRRLEAQLQQSQKMEAIGTLAGGIAHDFNNILSAIMGNIEISLAEVAKESKLALRLRRVRDACERAKDLVLQILMFSRRSDAQKPKPVYMNYIVKEVLKLIRASLPSTIKIESNITHEKKVVLSDPTQIHQVVMNLCSNAADAMMEKGGTLGITLDSVVIKSDGKTACYNLPPGEYIRLVVSDTGHGMSPEIRERIFDPFYTTKDQGKGTGMGLSLVHGIVTKMGGCIEAASEPENGSTFSAFFPKAERDMIPETETDESVPTGNERILFVDDEENIVEMAEEMLTELGYTVTAIAGSLAALSRFEKNPDDFDLVVSDQTMPDLTGMNMARKMLAIRPDIPIILATGFADLIEPDMVRSIGIREFILKPYSKGNIARLIRKAIDSAPKQPGEIE